MAIQTLIERQPMRGAAAAMLDAERALRNFQWQFSGSPRLRSGPQSYVGPAVQAVENEEGFVVNAELPGYAPEDIDVSVEEGVLTLKGTRKSANWSDDLPEEEKAKRTYRFERRIRFNGEIDEENVTANCKNGLLEVNVPKEAVIKPEVREIPVLAN